LSFSIQTNDKIILEGNVVAHRSWSWAGNGLSITFEGRFLKNIVNILQVVYADSSRVPMQMLKEQIVKGVVHF